jgi:hypothetical protein
MSTKMIRTYCYTILIIYEYVEFYLVKKDEKGKYLSNTFQTLQAP